MKVLLIDDDKNLCALLTNYLSKQGYEVISINSVEEAIGNSCVLGYDMIILDLMFAGKNGDNFVRYVNSKNSQIPIVVLSAVNDVDTKVKLLQMGVDDYITKPCNPLELAARIDAVYRRCLEGSAHHNESDKFGPLIFYWRQNKVVRDGREILLTKKEADVLKLLLQHPNGIVRNEDFLTKIWKAQIGFHSNVVQATMRRLRKKIDDKEERQLIQNSHGVGYRICI